MLLFTFYFPFIVDKDKQICSTPGRIDSEIANLTQSSTNQDVMNCNTCFSWLIWGVSQTVYQPG